jgi:hypothetical protein
MANELTLNATFRSLKDSTKHSLEVSGLQVSVSGTISARNRQNVGTSEELLDLGGVTVPGWCIIINRDATNFVEVRAATGLADLIRINAGEFALFRFAAECTTPYVIANTGAVEIEYILLEN